MQHGPGSENAFGGVAQAYAESSPILVLPAGYPRRIMNYYPDFSSSQAMRSVTKWAEPLTMGEAVPEVMRRAFFQLRNGRPGPVLVEIPRDVFDEEVRARAHPDPVGADERFHDGDRVAPHAGVDREIPRDGHFGQLRRHGEGVRRLRASASRIPPMSALRSSAASRRPGRARRHCWNSSLTGRPRSPMIETKAPARWPPPWTESARGSRTHVA